MKEYNLSTYLESSFKSFENYPRFNYLNRIKVPENGNIFIADLKLPPLTDSLLINLANKSNRTIVLYDQTELTDGLFTFLSDIQPDSCLLFPGNGGLSVLSSLKNNYPEFINKLTNENRIFSFPCERLNNKSINIEDPKEFNPINFKRIIIVDDVVASGQTLEMIKSMIYWLLPEIDLSMEDIRTAPFAKRENTPIIDAISWLSLSPRRRNNFGSSVYGISSLKTVVCYEGSGRIATPPCNSLSTLAKQSEKSQLVINSLKTKYFDSYILDELLNLIKQ